MLSERWAKKAMMINITVQNKVNPREMATRVLLSKGFLRYGITKSVTAVDEREFSAEAVRDLTENYLGGRHRRIFRGLLKDALLAVDEEGDLGGGIIEDARELKAAAAGLMEAYMQERNLLPPADGRQLFQQGRYIQPSEEFRGR